MDNNKENYYLDLFKELPHINENKEIIDDWGYTPSLYHFDGKWFVSWIHCKEGDTILDYSGNTPEEAITKAYNNYKKDIKYPHKFNVGDNIVIINKYHPNNGEIGVISHIIGDIYYVTISDFVFGEIFCTLNEEDLDYYKQ